MSAPVLVGGFVYYDKSLTENNATTQRSRIRNIQMTFDQPVTLTAASLNVELVNGPVSPYGQINVTVASVVNNGDGTCTATFQVSGTSYGVLVDGNYTVTLIGSTVSNSNGETMTSNPTDSTFSYFGDSNGDRKVNGTDLAVMQHALRSRLGMSSYLSYMDYDGNGIVDTGDYNLFLAHYMTMLNLDGSISPV